MEDKRGDEETVPGGTTSEEGLLSAEDREQQESPRTWVVCDEAHRQWGALGNRKERWTMRVVVGRDSGRGC